MLVLGDMAQATKLKLMEVPGAASKKTDNATVPAQLGYRYLTIHIADGKAAADRLKKAGVKPVAKGPVPLPAGFPANNTLTVVRDPDGNLVELVGRSRSVPPNVKLARGGRLIRRIQSLLVILTALVFLAPHALADEALPPSQMPRSPRPRHRRGSSN